MINPPQEQQIHKEQHNMENGAAGHEQKMYADGPGQQEGIQAEEEHHRSEHYEHKSQVQEIRDD